MRSHLITVIVRRAYTGCMGNRQGSHASNKDVRNATDQDLKRAAERVHQLTASSAESSVQLSRETQHVGTELKASDATDTKAIVLPATRAAFSPSAIQRARECLSRGDKPLIKDELIAIILTIDPAFPVSRLQCMRVGDLNKQVRALVVNVSLDKLGFAESENPT